MKYCIVHMAPASFAAKVESESECCKTGKKKAAYMVKAAKYFLWKQDLLLDSEQRFRMV